MGRRARVRGKDLREPRPSRKRPLVLLGIAALVTVTASTACSPIYVIKAGLAEWRILRARQDIAEVLARPELDEGTKGKLVFVLEARRFAEVELGMEVGGAYSTYVELESDTLALIVSAAEKDRLVPKTWWFPIVGRVPYRGHFSARDAEAERLELEAEGYDALVRPTAAFSTLGWFDDPVLSTILRRDDVEVVATILHELAHRHLFVSGHVDFNESFATFVGRIGAARFFCGRDGGGPDTLKCLRAEARWRDHLRFGAYIDELRDELTGMYSDSTLTRDEKLERRETVFRAALDRFDSHVTPELESFTFAGFRTGPLNNATLLSRIRYYHRLADFQAVLDNNGGDLEAALRALVQGVREADDPWESLGGVGSR